MVCCLTLAELRRLALRGVIEAADADLLKEAVMAVCDVVWIDGPDLLERAARLSHGVGVPLVDALIVAAAEGRGAVEVWTADGDLLRCTRDTFRVRLLSPARS